MRTASIASGSAISNPRYLRNAEARTMTDFAQALFDETDGVIATGDDHFPAVWEKAIVIAREP